MEAAAVEEVMAVEMVVETVAEATAEEVMEAATVEAETAETVDPVAMLAETQAEMLVVTPEVMRAMPVTPGLTLVASAA